MNPNEDYDPEQPSRSELMRRIAELERDNQRLNSVLEETFDAWLTDRKRLAEHELAELTASMTEMLKHPESMHSLSDVLAELKQEFGDFEGNDQPPT